MIRALWLFNVAVAVVTGGLLIVGGFHATPASGLTGLAGTTFVAAGVAFATIGALIASRVPGNPIGPLFCAIGTILSVGTLAFQYADLALFIHPGLPGGTAAAWLQNFGLPSCFGLLAIAVILFPDGHVPSRHWRWVVVLAITGITFNATGYALRPGPMDPPFETVGNPLGIPGTYDLFDAVTGFGWIFMGVSAALAGVGAGRRLRRSHGVERAQLKWLALAGATAGTAIGLVVLSYFVPVGDVDEPRTILLGLGFVVFPLTVGAAILRRRLYDIDVVINRALVYGALTATLGATYLGLVLLIGLTVGRNNVAIAVSTLAVAALFRPARARIQDGVDRRFYRRRYDATRTLEAFGARLRDEVDIDSVSTDLRAAVRDTVQPAHLTLWLRP